MANEVLNPDLAYATSGGLVGGVIAGGSPTYSPNSYAAIAGVFSNTAAQNRLIDAGWASAVTLTTGVKVVNA